jgi:tetratricopeptide (TPR) repeat protein
LGNKKTSAATKENQQEKKALPKNNTPKARDVALNLFNSADPAAEAGDYVKFCEIMEQVKKIDPTFTDALISLAQVQIILEKFEEAIPNCDQVLANKPNDMDALLLKIKAYENLNDVKNTMACLEQCVDADRFHFEEIQKLIRLYRLSGKYEKIIGICDKIVDTMGDKDEILDIRASALSQLGRLDEALQNITEAIRLAPRNKNHYDLRGYIYETNNEPEKALEDYKIAINFDKINAMELKLGLSLSSQQSDACLDDKKIKKSKPKFKNTTSKKSEQNFFVFDEDEKK